MCLNLMFCPVQVVEMGAALSWVREPSYDHEIALATRLGLRTLPKTLYTDLPSLGLTRAAIFGLGLGSGMLVAAVHRRLTYPHADDMAGQVLDVEQRVGLVGVALVFSGVLILSLTAEG